MNRSTSGVALIVVLWVMAVLTLLMYAFLDEMGVEYALAGGGAEELKAEQLAWSAMDLAAITVVNDTKPWQDMGDIWAHDPFQFFERALGDGAFSILHPTYGDDPRLPVRWGLEDEASKANLNTAPKEILLRLPRMAEEIADSIVDWRDADATPGPQGAESPYYQSQNPPYACKDQPFETLEEILFVRGMTPEILYGEDANLNGVLDPAEDDGDRNLPLDNADGILDPGLYAFVTVWSQEENVNLEGERRVNLNTASPDELRAAGLGPSEVQAVMTRRAVRGPFPTVAHLLDFLSTRRFRGVVDAFTVVDAERIPGRINVNTAPQAVLLVLPGVTGDLALKIMEYRTRPDVDLSNIGWLLDVMDPQVLQGLANFVTVRSQQFRIHAVGRVGTPYGVTPSSPPVPGRPGAFKRMLGVFDKLARPRPRLVYWKDATKLGMPYDPEDGPWTR